MILIIRAVRVINHANQYYTMLFNFFAYYRFIQEKQTLLTQRKLAYSSKSCSVSDIAQNCKGATDPSILKIEELRLKKVTFLSHSQFLRILPDLDQTWKTGSETLVIAALLFGRTCKIIKRTWIFNVLF